MALGGVWMIVIGMHQKKVWEAGFGCCVIGIVVSGYLATSNEVYSWLQLAFSITLVSLAIVRLFLKARTA